MGKRDRIDVGPSSAARWSVCTASPQFIVRHADELPEDSSVFADEGTQAHAVAANLLLGKAVPEDTPSEMLAHATNYADFVRSHWTEGARLLVEKRIPLFYLPSRNGMVDAATQRPDALFIDDLKYGVGVSVDAENNEQIAIYAESLIREWEQIMEFRGDMPVHLSIFQPRDRNNPNPVRTWTLTRLELSKFTTTLGAKARVALSENGEFVYSEKGCRFCPAKGICSAYANHGLVALPEEARVITLPDPGVLTRDQRIKVLKAKKVLKEWLDAVESQEFSDLESGAPSMGFKLVEGKANRQWADEDAAQKLCPTISQWTLRGRGHPSFRRARRKTLKGITLSARFKSRMSSLITKPEGKPTLVPEDDKRPSINLQPKIDNIDVI